jgi:hypothetical protein
MSDVRTIVTHFGRSRLSAVLGVNVNQISNVVSDGRFPANWYAVLSDMCASEGIPCPLRLFAMKRPAQQETGDAA